MSKKFKDWSYEKLKAERAKLKVGAFRAIFSSRGPTEDKNLIRRFEEVTQELLRRK